MNIRCDRVNTKQSYLLWTRKPDIYLILGLHFRAAIWKKPILRAREEKNSKKIPVHISSLLLERNNYYKLDHIFLKTQWCHEKGPCNIRQVRSSIYLNIDNQYQLSLLTKYYVNQLVKLSCIFLWTQELIIIEQFCRRKRKNVNGAHAPTSIYSNKSLSFVSGYRISFAARGLDTWTD